VVPMLFGVGLTLEEIQQALGVSPALSVALIRAEAGWPCT
jgi:hypothetical protein